MISIHFDLTSPSMVSWIDPFGRGFGSYNCAFHFPSQFVFANWIFLNSSLILSQETTDCGVPTTEDDYAPAVVPAAPDGPAGPAGPGEGPMEVGGMVVGASVYRGILFLKILGRQFFCVGHFSETDLVCLNSASQQRKFLVRSSTAPPLLSFAT